jgi:ketosteroid isomerase-like protein
MTISDYTADSVIFTAEGMFKGLTQIRAFFDGLIKNMPPGMVEAFSMIRQDIDGEVAYMLWKAEAFVPLGTDTFVIRGGKIVAQTYTVFTPH